MSAKWDRWGRTKERLLGWAFIFGPMLFLAALGAAVVYFVAFAPCSSLGWMSITQIPARCLEVRP